MLRVCFHAAAIGKSHSVLAKDCTKAEPNQQLYASRGLQTVNCYAALTWSIALKKRMASDLKAAQ
jgi:hypothetical protein